VHNMGIALDIHESFNLNRAGFGDLHIHLALSIWLKNKIPKCKATVQLRKSGK